MDIQVTGLDRDKLSRVGVGYSIDIYRWMFAVNMFESCLVSSFNQKEE